MESVPVGLLVVDPSGEIILCNNAASRILEYERETIEGKGWAELFLGQEENTSFNDVIVDVIYGKSVNLHREVCYISPKGAVRRLSTTSSFLHEDDELAGIVILLDDVTEIFKSRQREKEILEENNRIQSERAESLKKLALGVAHEIRNPTTFIGGFANRMLKQIGEGNPFEKYLCNILIGTKRLEDIVTAVSSCAYISTIAQAEILVAEIIEKARIKINTGTALTTNQIDWRIHIEPVIVFGDAELLASAIYEIIRNALESIEQKPGIIGIKSGYDDNSIYIEISDTGIGIPPENLPFIFDPFFSTKPDRIGMGLPNAQSIITEHSGEIKIYSSATGTNVKIFLPYHTKQ